MYFWLTLKPAPQYFKCHSFERFEKERMSVFLLKEGKETSSKYNWRVMLLGRPSHMEYDKRLSGIDRSVQRGSNCSFQLLLAMAVRSIWVFCEE